MDDKDIAAGLHGTGDGVKAGIDSKARLPDFTVAATDLYAVEGNIFKGRDREKRRYLAGVLIFFFFKKKIKAYSYIFILRIINIKEDIVHRRKRGGKRHPHILHGMILQGEYLPSDNSRGNFISYLNEAGLSLIRPLLPLPQA